MSQFNWIKRLADGWSLTVYPAATVLQIKPAETGKGWQATCLGEKRFIPSQDVEEAKLEAVVWFRAVLDNLRDQLAAYMATLPHPSGGER